MRNTHRAQDQMICGRQLLQTATTRLAPLSLTYQEYKALLMQQGNRTTASKLDPSLLNYESAEKVAHCLPGLRGSVVVEVNPGFGVLTRALLNAGAQQVIALEHERTAFLPALKKLEAAVPTGALRVLYCSWKRLDAINGPTRPPALSSAEVMGGVPIKPWEEGCLGYIVGVNPAPQNKCIIQHLMRLANREGMTQWGRMTLALVCDQKTVQAILAQPGTRWYNRVSVKAQLLCDVEVPLKIPAAHLSHLTVKSSTAKAKKVPTEECAHLVKLTPKLEQFFSDPAESEFFFDAMRQIMVTKRRPLAEVLMSFHSEAPKLLDSLGIPHDTTPPQLSPQSYHHLIRKLYRESLDHHIPVKAISLTKLRK